ncbi:methyl-accepting chemotaxis protein [Sporomusa aerivorans]|uniref:methyl-accepting chemotaxis protein n=1 Tax=Sporomusa aerivorans TaxID=204936 RepID=UPI00352B737A
MKITKIQTRLLIILLPLIVAVLGALAGLSYYLSTKALVQSVDETAMAIGTDYANRVQSDMEKMLFQLEDLASTPNVRSGADKAQIVQAMAETQTRLGTFDVMIFATPDGAGVSNKGAAATYSDRDYFKQVISTGKSVVSDPLVSKATGKLAVALAVPVTNNGQLTGVLIGTFSMDRLSNMIKEVKFLDTGYGMLADNSGVLIAHPKRPELAGKLSLLAKQINPELKLAQSELDERLINIFKQAADSGKQGRGIYSFVDDVTRIAVSTPLDLPGNQRWIMLVAAPEAEATKATDALARAILILSVVCLIIAVAAIVVIARHIAKPIAVIRDECLLLAQGDLRERAAKVSSEDEIGQLAQGFREMRTQLRTLIAKVHSQAEQLAASSEELTASAEQSAQAATQVAVSITEVATGAGEQLAASHGATGVVQEMSASIQQVAATTNEVAGQSAQAAAKANEGSNSVNKAVTQMIQIESTVNASAKVVAELGERSKEIGQIVGTIAGIAGQTNLLALNAAIEAARAGEQGRGFAVVAEEVRKLAEQSHSATEQIANLIGGIQGDTDKAVQAMDEGTKEVKLGAEVVTAAGQAFEEIVVLVTQVSAQVREITVAIDQMANGSQQIVGAVNQIDELSKKAAGEAQTVSAATEEQSASMEEIAASSQSLARLAGELQEAVGKFQI